MFVVFLMIAVLWGIGAAMKAPRKQRWIMTGILLGGVLIVQLILPDGHPLREATGSSPMLWALILAFGAIVYAYRLGLGKLRAAAGPSMAPEPVDPSKLTEAELDRYARHIVLREIGGAGQRALKQAKVLIIGAGGLGSPVGLYLAASGVGTIGIIDDDTVDASNLQRQIIHTDDAIGVPKVESAADRIAALNPYVSVRTYNRKLTAVNSADLFADFDIIVDGSDSYDTRSIANAAAVAARKPLVSGALGSWDGQVTVFDPAQGTGCYACLFPTAPDPAVNTSCAATGVAAPVPGIVGSLMTAEVVKLITGAGTPLRGQMLIYDGLHADTRKIALRPNPQCPVCGPNRKES